MALDENELRKEKEYLEKVKLVLEKMISKEKGTIQGRKEEIDESKEFMWRNLSDYTDEERAKALYDVDHDVNLINQKIDEIKKYEKSLKNPYFGKIIFKSDSSNAELPVYIGIGSVNEGYNFYVFDWRAPISSLFYNYEVGKAEYDAPVGKISGDILSKMQFKIRDGKLIRCFKCDINIDDEYLQEILANSTGNKMQNIVCSIQREQNEIIRNENDKFLIVQGTAGSGKTSVALHRIAYLLYKDKSLSNTNILILSPTDVFSEYISSVLPELGEDNVLNTTFSNLSSIYLKPYKNIENYCQFLERMYNNVDEEEMKLIKYKMSEKFETDIAKFLDEYIDNLCFQSGISAGNLFISSEKLKTLFTDKFGKLPLKDRFSELSEYVCSALGLPKTKYFSVIKNQLINSCGIELNFFEMYRKFLSSHFFDNYDDNNIIKGKINYEDIAGLLFFQFEINGYPKDSNIRHVVIDEAQDYSHFQMKLIKKIFDRSSFTVLGDINQDINPCFEYSSLKKLSDIFLNSKYVELSKTYRSSNEIVDYSNMILGLNNVCAIRNDMNFPVVIREVSPSELSQQIKNDIETMKESSAGRVAIITKNSVQALKLFQQLHLPDAQLILTDDDVINSSYVVIPSYLAKGLEFDGVIVYNNPNDDYSDCNEKLFYVACTRAQQQLIVYNEPTKVLKKVR